MEHLIVLNSPISWDYIMLSLSMSISKNKNILCTKSRMLPDSPQYAPKKCLPFLRILERRCLDTSGVISKISPAIRRSTLNIVPNRKIDLLSLSRHCSITLVQDNFSSSTKIDFSTFCVKSWYFSDLSMFDVISVIF